MAKNSKKTSETVQTENAVQSVEPSFFDSKLFWRVGSVFVLVVAFALRFTDLALKPFHHDEGVNGFFLTNLVRQGVYKYDPSNYHGPTLYYFAQAASYLFGLNDFAVRFVTAIFGVFTVVGILYLRRYLGSVGALVAAMLIALSPGMVYISRYFIHEMLFVFFTFGVVLAVIKFWEREQAGRVAVFLMSVLLLVCFLPGTINFANTIGGENLQTRNVALAGFFVLEAGIVFALVWALMSWHNGRPIYLLLASASLVLTFATKETAFISFGTMLIALVCIAIWLFLRRGEEEKRRKGEPLLTESSLLHSSTPPLLFSTVDIVIIALLCLAVFAYVGALFFSSFFTYQEGISAAFEAYAFWTKTGSKDHTQNGIWAYLDWLIKIESPLLILGALGAIITFWKAKHKFALFAALWAFGLLAAYSIIPYKTPWLAVNFILPLGLIAGYAINELATSRETWRRGAAAFLATVAFGVCAYQTIELNFYQYDDNSRPYIYAHTKRDIFDLIKEVERVAEASGEKKEANIIIVSPDYWSLPWYLRDYPNAAFYGQIQPSSDAEMVVGSTAQSEELTDEYDRYFTHTETYTLRPGVDLMLYVRKDLAQKMAGK